MPSRTNTTEATPGTITTDPSETGARRARSRRRSEPQLFRKGVETAIHRRFRTWL
jgi:hypothetical protein